ncbi:MAG: glycosyltransferase [Candidatus Omnitrophota bacterium]|jgi:glycosyltransferase involved in cell wall biosynthesis
MKVAIFHNFMDNIGGAEIVGLTLARELNADFYTTNIDEDKIRKMGFSDINLESIGKVPINAPFRHQTALWRFRQLNLKKRYDFFIIDGDWAVSGAVNNKPNLWFVHSPIREIWDLYQYTRENIVHPSQRWIFDAWARYNRHLNKKYVKHVNKIVCNSENTRKRVKKYLQREAAVINPPIEISRYHYKEPGDYWLSVNRLFYHKRIDMQIKAFSRLPNEKLIIVGSYERSRHFQSYADYIKKIKPENVEIISWVNSDKLIDLYANCKGFITSAKDEDFGMAVIEAMASGKPVIAPNEGGYRETVIDGITGKLINDINIDKLVNAIKETAENPQRYKDACLKQAQKFDTKVFINKIKEQIGDFRGP